MPERYEYWIVLPELNSRIEFNRLGSEGYRYVATAPCGSMLFERVIEYPALDKLSAQLAALTNSLEHKLEEVDSPHRIVVLLAKAKDKVQQIIK